MDLFVEKDTDLMRSTFVAIGLAALFERLPARGVADVRIIDLGSAYRVQVPYDRETALDHLAARGGRLPLLIPAIRKAFSEKERKTLDVSPEDELRFKYVPQGFITTHIVEYEAEQAIAKAAPKKRVKDERQEGDAPQPHRDYPLWAHLCSYFNKGSTMRVGYPNVLHAWHAHHGEVASATLDAVISTYLDYPNATDDLRSWWAREVYPALTYRDFEIRPDISSLAAVSPSTAKGGYATTAAAILTEDTPEEFWLVMYLAFAGFMIAAMPFTLGSDVLTFYPLPKDISVASLRADMDAYREDADVRSLYSFSNLMMRPKLDALAIITFYLSMVRHFRTAIPTGFLDEYAGSFSGIAGYYYKDIGGTQIAFDETIFALPPWLPKSAAGDTDALQGAEALLKLHHDMVSYLRGKPPKNALTADELIVLKAYRTFITTGTIDDWIDFAIQYHFYRFARIGEMYHPDLPLDVFERTILSMKPQHYQAILENEGFRNIAAAIRHCTITTLYLEKVKKIDTGFKVRHGLGDDLLRHADDADSSLFVADLTRFLHDYARESSNVQASDPNKVRPFVTESDLFQVIGVIDAYGTGPVAHLLVAAGYASAYRKSDDSQS